MIPRVTFMLTSTIIQDQKPMSLYKSLLTELQIKSLLKSNQVRSFACGHGEHQSP
jgi:hypothetical protein